MDEQHEREAFRIDPLEQAIDAYLAHYELDDGESVWHQPSEFESFLIKDAIMGLLVDPEWDRLWGEHIQALADEQAASSHQEWNPNEWSDERIDNMAELIIKGMPDGISGFCRTWGWQQFARALIEICKLPPPAQPVEAPQASPID